MKSPWKFLVGLARRHDRQDGPNAIAKPSDTGSPDSDLVVAHAIELEAAPASSNLVLSPVSSGGEEEPEHLDDLTTLAAIAAAVAEGKGEKPRVATGGKAPESPRSNAGRNKRAHIKSTPAPTVRPGDSAQVLDDEIHQLRSQLARKLERQNAQLRKMLARFEN